VAKGHPAWRARKVVLFSSAFAAAGLTGYLAVAAPAPASGSPTNGQTSTDSTDTPQTTQGTIPRRGRSRNPTPVPAPSQPSQSKPQTRSAGS
jgi:hypothetical protein